MSVERKMKKIDMDTLESAERKISVSKFRRAGVALVVIALLGSGGYAAYRMMTGQVIGSRFTVNKMNCPACVITVKEVTGKIPGVVETDVSLAAQDVTVKFRDKQTNSETIQEAIARAGYPVKLDGLFKPMGSGINEVLVADVNGKPVFERDLKLPFDVVKKETKHDVPSAFFSVVGKKILLDAADAQLVVVQPYEVEAEVQRIFEQQGASREEFLSWISSSYGSPEKYYQIVGQRLGIRKLLEENVLQGVQDPSERKRKAVEWAGKLFKEADVKILDPGLKERVYASVGQDEWKTLWPRMIAQDTELKSLLVQ
ncbi:MAG: cation transporter [Deltaproteobacteria bacterium]|nr:cation transporter [Deltaproteobacteria bacterium]